MEYRKKIEIRWSDMDPNFHLRHSIYYDIGAYSRISFLNEHGFTPAQLIKHQLGPIIFREECIFKKEVHFGDTMEVTLALKKSYPDMSRWTMVHELWKNETILAAVITIDGAWMDIVKRKLAMPPAELIDTFNRVPKTEDFEWLGRL